jgi:hypothetical protein
MVKRRLSKKEAQVFRTRWKEVNAAEADELRQTPMALKLRQLAALAASAGGFGRPRGLAEGKAEVRRRWNRLREVLGAQIR